METSAGKTVIFAAILWTILLLLTRKLLPNRSYEFCTRIVSTAHAIFAVALASRSVRDWTCPVCPLASASSPKQMQALGVSVGYFTYDLICSQFDKKSGLDNSIHHLVSILGLGSGLVYQKCGSEMVAALFITEISTPFLNLREFLKELGYKDTTFNLAADILFALIFTLARMTGGPYLVYVTLLADYPFLIKATASGMQIVNTFWFYKILKMVKYKLFTKPSATRKIA